MSMLRNWSPIYREVHVKSTPINTDMQKVIGFWVSDTFIGLWVSDTFRQGSNHSGIDQASGQKDEFSSLFDD